MANPLRFPYLSNCAFQDEPQNFPPFFSAEATATL